MKGHPAQLGADPEFKVLHMRKIQSLSTVHHTIRGRQVSHKEVQLSI